MFCPWCGKENEKGEFCAFCGRSLSGKASAEKQTVAQASAKNSTSGAPSSKKRPDPKPKKSSKITVSSVIGTALSVLIPAAVLIAAVNLLGRRDITVPLWPFVCLAGIFLIFLVIDILGHFKIRLKRSVFQWILLTAVATGLVLSGTSLALSLRGAGSKEQNLNMVYRYLLDGQPERAREKAASLSGELADLIDFLCDSEAQDYLSIYFSADRVLEGSEIDEETKKKIIEIKALAGEVIGVKIDDETGEVIETTAEDIALVGITADEDISKGMSEEDRKVRIKQLVTEICDNEGAADALSEENEDEYILDNAVNFNDYSLMDYSFIEELTEKDVTDEDTLRALVGYYAQDAGTYEKAKEWAYELVNRYPKIQNYIIYTDLYAEMALNEDYEIDAEDEEARQLIEQVESLEDEAERINTQLPSEEERYNDLMNEANELRRKAKHLNIYRAINYILSKEPLFGDDTGMLDLQLAKLYAAADDGEKAKEYIWKVINEVDSLSKDSPIYEPLLQVIDAYNDTTEGAQSPILTESVDQLIEAQSGGVINSPDSVVNSQFGEEIVSTLKYDRTSIFISRIDTTDYPTIRAYVNISGEKDDEYGLAEGFEKEDFELIDTQYKIDSFELVRDEEAENVSIALVLDRSSSMSGSPVENAKEAALAVVQNMTGENQEIALITYNRYSEVTVPLTDSVSELTAGIESIQSSGGTNISGAIETALGELSSAEGTRAVILLTDGRDEASAEEMENAVSHAASMGIPIYTVGLGEVDTGYLTSIAQSTGGIYVSALENELTDIYLMLQKYIVNNYCFEYEVTENLGTDPRFLRVTLLDYSEEAEKAYQINGEPVAEAQEDGAIYPVEDGVLKVYSLTPGSVNAGDLTNGIRVSVKGSGFTDGVKISVGGTELTDVIVENAGFLTGTLTGTFTPGALEVTASLPNGMFYSLKNGFRVFDAGTVATAQIGNVFVIADNIGIVSENESTTVLAAAGNVCINSFLYSTAELEITPYQKISEEEWSNAVNQRSVYLGSGGSITGDGKIYVSYAQTVQTAEEGDFFERMAGRTFAQNILGGRDLIVTDGDFSMSVGEKDTNFDTGGASSDPLDELNNFSVKLPGFAEMQMATVTLYSDRLQLDVYLLDIDDITDNLVTAMSGGVKSTKKNKKAIEKNIKDKVESATGIDMDNMVTISGSLSVGLGASDIRFGGEVSLDLPNNKKFFLFPIRSLEAKINSLDENYEYWSFATVIALPGTGDDDMGLAVSLGSYFWYPDSAEIGVKLDPGIPVFKVLNITEVGGGFTGFSRLFTDEEEVQEKDATVKVFADADVNVFKLLGLKTKGAAASITRWGELGKIDDAQVLLNFSDMSLDISADLEILQTKVASAKIGISSKKFLAEGDVGADFSCAGLEIGGNLGLEVSVTWAGETQDGVSALLGLEGSGYVKCSWTNFDVSGNVGLELSADIGTSSGTIIAAKVSCNGEYARVWYDSEGVMLWDKFHAESTF